MTRTIQRSIMISLFLIIGTKAHTQEADSSGFDFKSELDYGLLTAGLAANAAAGWLYFKTRPLTIPQVQKLESTSLTDAEWKTVSQPEHHRASEMSDYLMYSACLAPLFVLKPGMGNNELPVLATMLAETFLWTNAVTWLGKTALQRPRPFMYDTGRSATSKLSKNGLFSYISGHTSSTACVYFFSAYVMSRYAKKSWVKTVSWIIAASIPALTGYYRVRAKQHFPGDVIRGYAVGALAGILVPHLHLEKKQNGRVHFRIAPNWLGIQVNFN